MSVSLVEIIFLLSSVSMTFSTEGQCCVIDEYLASPVPGKQPVITTTWG